MNYTVVWAPRALRQLADVWVNASNRGAVSAASAAIDAALQLDPLSAGESRDSNRRVLILPPLAVLYSVDRATREVTIWGAWPW